MRRFVLPILLIVCSLLSACVASQHTPAATAPRRTATAGAATASSAPQGTSSGPVLALPAEFGAAYAAQAAQLDKSVRIEQAADSAAALAQVKSKKAAWAVSAGLQPSPQARLLCLAPYVALVHFSSPLENVSAARLQAIYQGRDWPGPVLYSGDAAVLRRVLGLQTLGPQVTALPSWQAVIERVAGDRTAIAFAPWTEVDARVKALSLDGRSIAANGIQGYGLGDAWWLSSAAGASSAATDDIVATLSCPSREPLTFLAAGDAMMSRFAEPYIKTEGAEYPFRRIADMARAADIAFINFENPMSSRGVMENKGLMFRASPEVVKGLAYAGIDVVNLANNHMGDYGAQAVQDTLDTLRQNGIAYVGAGRDRAEARSPWITTTKGTKIALLGYNEIEPGYFAATDSQAGTAWLQAEMVYAEIKQAKTQADFVIVTFHWGTEYTPHPTSRQRDVAQRTAEAGAGLVIGHHPHVVQGVGFAGSVFIDYSLGDFVYSQPSRPATGEAVLLRALIDGAALKQVQMIPIYIDKAQPEVVSPLEAKLMMARIFDATRLYKGLPAASEQARQASGAVALPQGSKVAPAGSLAYVSISGQQADIALAGGGTQNLITADGNLNDAPAWSPDGTRLAFSSARDGNVDIFLTTLSGSAVNLTQNPGWDDYPAWSPAGTAIAFSSNREGAYKIYVMNADGSGVRRLTSGAAWDTTPAWSPDGKRLAFASDRMGTFQIYVMDVDGGNLRQVTNYPNLNAFPAWSPDGKLLAYQSYQDESANQQDDSIQDRDYEIMVVSAGGGKPLRLTDNVAADVRPSWSPDGKRIAFSSDRDGSFQVYVMQADGSAVTAVTSGPDAHLAPAWAPGQQ